MANDAQPQYQKIANDIAFRIANGEFPQDSRIYGRSMLASEYHASPETIRRALKLLSDMRVVETTPKSGTTVLSADNAKRYLESRKEASETSNLRGRLKTMLEECAALHRGISSVMAALAEENSRFASSYAPLPNFDVTIPADSPVVGRNIGSLRFWQDTGATIVAIRRNQNVIVSPGPYAELYPGDVIILVGSLAAIKAAEKLVAGHPEE